MKKIIVEKALVKYNKNGEYENTVESDFFNFDTKEDARKFIQNNLKQNYEYYLYDSNVEPNKHFDVIIANKIIK